LPEKESPRVLVVHAHPDDPEFSCGGTIAKWTSTGSVVTYCLLTRGERGNDQQDTDLEELGRCRVAEQRAAAKVLGVEDVRFLDYPDGYLVPDLTLRKDIVRVIRQVQPQVVVTSDPTNYFPTETYINHADHRAAGEATLAAVFPAAGSALFFPELLEEEGLQPHKVEQVYITNATVADTCIDVTAYFERKVQALKEHTSQIRSPERLRKRLQERMMDPESSIDAPRYIEQFRRIDLRR
jgi:LmbE family N-acetylglucosaminyl deacetylase